ncbi:MAG: TlpA disulfide reductase family protein [Acidimicrobiales bacterium]
MAASERENHPASRTKRIFIALGVGCAIALFATAIALAFGTTSPNATILSPSVAGRPVGARLPVDFELARLGGGRRVDLSRLVEKRVAVINVFASWCPACEKELDAFGKVSREFRQSVAFVGVDSSEPNPRRSEALLEAAHAHYPVGLDTTDLTVADSWGVTNLPVTFFLRANGTIAAEHLGAESPNALRREVRRLIGAAGRV